MSKAASQYDVTTPYGCVKGYPLHQELCKVGYGFHMGEDRAMPVGTPVLVNGHHLGDSGNTGYVTGPHLHIGKFVRGVVNNPKGKGFHFVGGVKVTQIGHDSVNGNFVRVVTRVGGQYVYLHLSKIRVKVGQRL